mgnify:CR=1 FL=1
MSVPKSMQRIVTVPRGRGMSKMMNIKNGLISGMLLVSVYAMDFFKLSKINRPKERKQSSLFGFAAQEASQIA